VCSVRLEADRPDGHALPAWPPRPIYAPEPSGPVRALLGVMTSKKVYIWELKYMGARKLVQIPPSATARCGEVTDAERLLIHPTL
jgi:hypothetical protein